MTAKISVMKRIRKHSTPILTMNCTDLQKHAETYKAHILVIGNIICSYTVRQKIQMG